MSFTTIIKDIRPSRNHFIQKKQNFLCLHKAILLTNRSEMRDD